MGLIGMARTISIEGARYNIRANVLAPGAFTRMTENLMPEGSAARLTPERVAPVVAYLCHESCTLAGQILSASGGRVAHIFVAENRGYTNPDLTIEDRKSVV